MSVVSNNRRLRPEKVAPYFFISPFYIIFTIFFLLPTIASFILAFYKWKGVKAPKPRGWGNFEYLFLKTKTFGKLSKIQFFILLAVYLLLFH